MLITAKLLSLELSLYRLHRSQALSISLVSASFSSLQVWCKPCLKLLLKLRLSSFQVFITNSRSFSHSSSPKLTLFLVSGSQAQALSKFTLSMAIDVTWKPEETRCLKDGYCKMKMEIMMMNLEILYALPEVREWSPLYEAAIEILIDNEGNRRVFVTMKTNEAKIRFLELRTKIKRDDD
ncbi:hypothetical protein YC2023_121868 [Brassica napus]